MPESPRQLYLLLSGELTPGASRTRARRDRREVGPKSARLAGVMLLSRASLGD